jgi:hypothetical protein
MRIQSLIPRGGWWPIEQGSQLQDGSYTNDAAENQPIPTYEIPREIRLPVARYSSRVADRKERDRKKSQYSELSPNRV